MINPEFSIPARCQLERDRLAERGFIQRSVSRCSCGIVPQFQEMLSDGNYVVIGTYNALQEWRLRINS